MSQQVKINKLGFETRAYKNAIDTSFSQLVPPQPPIEEIITIDQFFELYRTLFYEIPSEGDNNSHEFLIKRSSDYIGYTEETDNDIQILLDEITSLREELLSTQRELRDAQISGSLQLQAGGNVEGAEDITPGGQLSSNQIVVGG